eukprot:1639439-Rhodomonas_salina.1
MPHALGNLSAIVDLQLQGNKIEPLENEILEKGRNFVARFNVRQYEAVKSNVLDLSVLALRSIPERVFQSFAVTNLSLANNMLTEIPPEIHHLTNLVVLDVSCNFLSTLPVDMASMALQRLLMAENKLITVPAVVHEIGAWKKTFKGTSGIASVKELDVSRNRVISLPSGIEKMLMLEKLILDNNKINALTYVIGVLSQLQVLNVAFNEIATVPTEIGLCTALTELFLDDNKLLHIPGSIGNLTQLRLLGFSNNAITTMPLSFSALTRVERLYSDGNPLEVPSHDIRKRGGMSMLKYMGAVNMSVDTNVLSLASFCLEEIPREIFVYKAVTALTRLSLLDNILTELPEDICERMHALCVLDLSRNLLTSLPNSVTKLVQLTTLYMRDNRFVHFPWILWSLTGLETLSVSDNSVEAIPGEVMKLKKLESFQFAGNPITFPPPEVQMQDLPTMFKYLGCLEDAFAQKACYVKSFGLRNFPQFWNYQESWWYDQIPTLSLKDNSIRVIPPEIVTMSSLTELMLDDNKIEGVDPALCNLPFLTNLQLNNNKIRTLPDTLWTMTNMTFLGLATNNFAEFPVEVCDCHNLKNLVLDDNNLAEVPMHICKLENMEILSLAMNKLEALPKSLEELSQLTELRVNRNKMRAVPECIMAMPWLVTLKIGENEFEHITEEMSTKSTAAMLRYRDMLDRAKVNHTLSITQMGLRTFPDEISEIQGLTQLSIAGNQIRILPDFLEQMTELMRFDGTHNALVVLPKSLNGLKHLLYLALDHNQLTNLPDAVSSLAALETLSVSHNMLQEISDELSCLQHLTCLDLQYNNLMMLPDALSALVSLEDLRLNNNRLLEITGYMVEPLTNVRVLRLNNNRLQYLPWELGHMESLQEIAYQANELDTPTPEILSLGGDDLMAYIRKVNKSMRTKILNLSHMRLSLYPHELRSVTVITNLDLSNNRLLEVDPVIAHMNGLTALNFENNALNSLP